jgi:4-alpha-glucanotransferase
MNELDALATLAKALGVHTHYVDGLEKPVTVGTETLLRVCSALGSPVQTPADAERALHAHQAEKAEEYLPAVVVAWDGEFPSLGALPAVLGTPALTLENGEAWPLDLSDGRVRAGRPLPPGYHRLFFEAPGGVEMCTVISAPVEAWRRPGQNRSWGLGTHLAALRSRRSRSVGDLRDLESVCRWVADRGGDLVSVLPLLPTFNADPAEPSPYSPVSRLFWSELILDLGDGHRSTPASGRLDVTTADQEVRGALADLRPPDASSLDDELIRYARFRGAQARLGRNWRDWPVEAKSGRMASDHIDHEEERFHLVAQTMVREQLLDLRDRLGADGFRLGLDLAVGVHPDGYDAWSRQALFAQGMSVGAPPDPGFPSGQDWGFPPVHPRASRTEGHRYLAASIAHQGTLAGVLRVDHIMAFTRLYWIPHGLGLHEGTYVSYPTKELFAVLTLESHRNQFEVVGENLGTVPPEIDKALPRHRIWGTYLAEYNADGPSGLLPPSETETAQVGTHDTPTFAGWLAGVDIDERVRCGLLDNEKAPAVREGRERAAVKLAEALGGSTDEPETLFSRLLEWLGRSESPLVVPWIEDLWLEREGVNLPGTRSSERPNWQRPMARLLDEVLADPSVERQVRDLAAARSPE